MKLVDLLNSQPVMSGLLQRKMPGKLAYAISRNVRLADAEIESYHVARIKLLSDNWKFNEKTQKYDISDEDQPKWQAMHKELVEVEVQVSPYMIDASMFDNVEVTPAEMVAIAWMIKE